MDREEISDHDFAAKVREILGADTNADALNTLKEVEDAGEDEVIAEGTEEIEPVDPNNFTERSDPSKYAPEDS